MTPWIIRQPRLTLPAGYRMVSFWDKASQTPYTLVYCTQTRAWVGQGTHYLSERAAIVGAMRSARMLKLNARRHAA